MFRSIRLSLATKCQLLFGAAVILIIVSALTVVWFRMEKLIIGQQRDYAGGIVNLWLDQNRSSLATLPPIHHLAQTDGFEKDLTLRLIRKDLFDHVVQDDPFLARSIGLIESTAQVEDQFEAFNREDGGRAYRYVRAVRRSQLHGEDAPPTDAASLTDPIEMIMHVQFSSDDARRQRLLNLVYVIAAGLVSMLLAIGAFWYVTTRLILSPVRVLRDTAAKIAEGDINIRSDINTGDEFEQLSEMFNTMVGSLNAKEQELRQINKSLDLRLGELAEHNVSLYEANRIKDEFLANVSHELRTPLNSIIGFAEVLEETLKRRTGPVDEKRKRYIANIIISSRRLLDLINDLLDLAKIEAGRLEVTAAPMSVADTAEGLINLIRPQAEKADITLRLRIEKDIPLVTTDAGKVQQIVFNFLSNAIKFTPPGGSITLETQMLDPISREHPARLCISVGDTGPGIAPDMHERIFDKFTQLDPMETRVHGGTGLGLTISRDLAKLLQGRIDVDSDVGRGATFSLTIPVEMQAKSTPLMPAANEPAAG